MWRVIRWGALAVVALVVIAGLLWTASRLSGPTEEQREAVARLQSPPAPGRDAFAALWLLEYDVPAEAMDAIAADDLRRHAAILHRPPNARTGEYDPPPMFVTSAAGRYPSLAPSASDSDLMCKLREAGCLAKVSRDPVTYGALVARNRALIDRVDALSRYDLVRIPTAGRVGAPMVPLTNTSRPLVARALEFASGDRTAALADTCRDIATWRRIGSRSDSLVVRLVGAANTTDGSGRLLADMLAALPRGEPLPAGCDAALAPMWPEEASICRAMGGEFQTTVQTIDALSLRDPQPESVTLAERANAWLLLDPARSKGQIAERLAQSCSPQGRARIAADLPPLRPSAAQARALLRFECAANAIGCILSDIAAPAYAEYGARAQDQAARIQLLGTLAWLRAQPDDGRTLAQKLASRPASLVSPTRPVEVTADGSAIGIRQFYTGHGATWQVPLPAFLRDLKPPAATASAPTRATPRG